MLKKFSTTATFLYSIPFDDVRIPLEFKEGDDPDPELLDDAWWWSV